MSRQLVGAAEAGRHRPSVDTALRLAGALGTTVESLFGSSRAAPTIAVDGPARPGQPVLVGRLGDRLRAVPMESLVGDDGAWRSPDGVIEDGSVRLLEDARAAELLVAGCDPVLGIWRSLLGGRLLPVAASSGDAIDALAAGRVHACVVHGPEGALPAAPRPASRWHVARWRTGIGVAESARARSSEAVLAGATALVQRARSAASQQALARAADAAGVDPPPPAAIADGHIDAARTAALAGCAGVTFEPAAHRFGLRFLPLETHSVELWVDARWRGHPATDALVDLLAAGAFRSRASLVGGYDLSDCGRELA